MNRAMNFGIRNIFLLAVILWLPYGLFAQEEDIQREVRVIKPYTPTLSDADKIDLQPLITDTTRIIPEISYSIFPRRYDSQFKVQPIQPARMVGLPLNRLYKSQLTLGLGNYLTPFIELGVNQLRSRKSSIGLYLNHQSSNGTVKLQNDRKADANYSDNVIKLYGKRMFYRSVLEGGITGGYNSLLYYGYRPEVDTLLFKDDIRQKIYSAGADVRFYSSNPDSFHFNYDFGLNYMLTRDAFENMENAFNINASGSKFIGDWYTGMDIGLDFYGYSAGIDSFNNNILSFNPWTSKSSDQWKVTFGLNAVVDQREESSFKLYPKVNFEFSIVDDVLIPYMGLDGRKEVNDYRRIIFENPYILPGLSVVNTDYSIIGNIGLKGRYSSKIAFDFRLSYSNIDSMYFYVNDTTSILQNQFTVDYDYANLLKAGGEIIWNKSDNLRFTIRGDYYHYELRNLEYPWHKPAFDASLRASYNLRAKILLDAALFYTGMRYAPGHTSIAEPVELKPYFDGNLSVEYRYTNVLSFFLKFRNFSATRYEVWNQYPAQRFQLMAGFTYAL